MNSIQIDALYAVFVDSLPKSLRGLAVDLPYAIKVAPAPGIPFSQVFSHPVTLGAPLLIAEAFPGAPLERIRSATMAHLLAVVQAFAADRLADQQIEASPELLALLEELKRARDRALDSTLPGASSEGALADAQAAQAIAEEIRLLRAVEAVDFADYERVSLGKQAPGFPASLALLRAMSVAARRIDQVERMLGGIWLALQFEDDAVDWEDDWRQGGAWAMCLARGLPKPADDSGEEATEPDIVRKIVLQSAVLGRMLRLARRCYRRAWRHARALGAYRIAGWAGERAEKVSSLIRMENDHAGYAVRARKLAPWAAEVLA